MVCNFGWMENKKHSEVFFEADGSVRKATTIVIIKNIIKQSLGM